MYTYSPASDAQAVFVDMVRELQPVLVGELPFTPLVGKIFRLHRSYQCWYYQACDRTFNAIGDLCVAAEVRSTGGGEEGRARTTHTQTHTNMRMCTHLRTHTHIHLLVIAQNRFSRRSAHRTPLLAALVAMGQKVA